MKIRIILAAPLLLFIFSGKINASYLYPETVKIKTSDVRGSWSISRSRGWNNSDEMRFYTDMKGNGSMDIEMEAKLNTQSSLTGFSVDLDMINSFSFTDKKTWESFDISLGTGLGTNFSTSSNNKLFFDLDQRTEDEGHHFLFDKNDYNSIFPNKISFWDGELPTGDEIRKNNPISSLTFFINTADSIDFNDDGFATFTMRVTGLTAVPLPAAWLLFLSGTTFLGFMSKRQNHL